MFPVYRFFVGAKICKSNVKLNAKNKSYLVSENFKDFPIFVHKKMYNKEYTFIFLFFSNGITFQSPWTQFIMWFTPRNKLKKDSCCCCCCCCYPNILLLLEVAICPQLMREPEAFILQN